MLELNNSRAKGEEIPKIPLKLRVRKPEGKGEFLTAGKKEKL